MKSKLIFAFIAFTATIANASSSFASNDIEAWIDQYPWSEKLPNPLNLAQYTDSVSVKVYGSKAKVLHDFLAKELKPKPFVGDRPVLAGPNITCYEPTSAGEYECMFSATNMTDRTRGNISPYMAGSNNNQPLTVSTEALAIQSEGDGRLLVTLSGDLGKAFFGVNYSNDATKDNVFNVWHSFACRTSSECSFVLDTKGEADIKPGAPLYICDLKDKNGLILRSTTIFDNSIKGNLANFFSPNSRDNPYSAASFVVIPEKSTLQISLRSRDSNDKANPYMVYMDASIGLNAPGFTLIAPKGGDQISCKKVPVLFQRTDRLKSHI